MRVQRLFVTCRVSVCRHKVAPLSGLLVAEIYVCYVHSVLVRRESILSALSTEKFPHRSDIRHWWEVFIVTERQVSWLLEAFPDNLLLKLLCRFMSFLVSDHDSAIRIILTFKGRLRQESVSFKRLLQPSKYKIK